MSDTTGHHSIAEEVGEKVLAPALASAGRHEANQPHQPMRIGAFYLGNWITDVSQVVDPVAFQAAHGSLASMVQGINLSFFRFDDDAPSWLRSAWEALEGDQALESLTSSLERAKDTLLTALRGVFGGGQSSGLATTFRAAFRFVGYAKFVLRDDGSEGKMDKESFYAVFDARYTQYYPHEHLDRPVVGTNQHGSLFDTRTGTGPRNGRTGTRDPGRDLYVYLRDDIEIAAGLLSYLDAGIDPCRESWAAATFHSGRSEFTFEDGSKRFVADDDPYWNIELAKLGHALHAVEDFFAHSTFVDHASSALPSSYQQFSRMEHGHMVARRLKRWRPEIEAEDWREAPNDSHVVTGSFDLWDTAVSLGHALDKAVGRPHDTIGQSIDHAIEYEYQKMFEDTLEFVSSPRQIWAEGESTTNVAARWVREHGGHSLHLATGQEAFLNKTIEIVLRHRLFANVDARAKDDFRLTVRRLGVVVGSAGLGITLYKAIKNLSEFLANPLGFLSKFVSSEIRQVLQDYTEVYFKNAIYSMLKAGRIGCHSLLAKDSGSEVLYKAAMDCSKTVHEYVCRVLVRHAQHPPLDLCRAGQDADNVNRILRNEWIDWLELLECFLAHPLAGLDATTSTIDVPVSVIHVTRSSPSHRSQRVNSPTTPAGSSLGLSVSMLTPSPDTLASLADRYSATTYRGPGSPGRLTWQMIADANFPTAGLSDGERARRINAALRRSTLPLGVPAADGVNYALRPGVRLVIPWQNHRLIQTNSTTPARWWYDVITQGHREGRNLGHHPIVVSHADALKRHERGQELRRAGERAYTPPNDR